mmetsp:Transcript_70504/g.206302  ORF Transcript_70504/g.206302 Transcript_70504/m.206302 type:complete len:132 (-) Transcript_70504:287-682(-)
MQFLVTCLELFNVLQKLFMTRCPCLILPLGIRICHLGRFMLALEISYCTFEGNHLKLITCLELFTLLRKLVVGCFKYAMLLLQSHICQMQCFELASEISHCTPERNFLRLETCELVRVHLKNSPLAVHVNY